MLGEIESAIEETFDPHKRHQEKTRAESRRTVYKKALKEAETVGGSEQMHALGVWIQNQIRDHQRLPSGREVRKRGAEMCRSNGHRVSTGSWLGA